MSCLLNLPGLGHHLPVADGGNLYLFAIILALPQLPPPHFKNIVWVAGVLVPVVSLPELLLLSLYAKQWPRGAFRSA